MNKLMTGVYDSLNLANIPALQGNGKVYDGSTSYDVVENWVQFEYTQPVTIFLVLEFFSPNSQCFISHVKDSTNPKGFSLYRLLDKMYYEFFNNFNISTQRKGGFSSQKLKIGKVAMCFALGGTGNASDDTLINNQIGGISINRNGLTGSIINDTQKLIIGRFGSITGQSYTNAKFKKLQILNFKANPIQLNKLFNEYDCQAIASDSQFLLDIDFNKTTGNPLTTRSGTPSYTITPYGSNIFSSFL